MKQILETSFLDRVGNNTYDYVDSYLIENGIDINVSNKAANMAEVSIKISLTPSLN